MSSNTIEYGGVFLLVEIQQVLKGDIVDVVVISYSLLSDTKVWVFVESVSWSMDHGALAEIRSRSACSRVLIFFISWNHILQVVDR